MNILVSHVAKAKLTSRFMVSTLELLWIWTPIQNLKVDFRVFIREITQTL